MKKHLFTTILVLAWFFQFGQVNAQATIPNENLIVSPERPIATDSILLTYIYTSTDGCPDYYLAIDSVSKNKIFVVRKMIMTKPACTAVITKFKTSINLGILEKSTQIYFEKKLIKTIEYQCVINKTGIIVLGQNDCANRLFIEDTSSPSMSPLPQLYTIEINNSSTASKLKVGDKVKFGGLLINNDSISKNPCYIVGIATCYELVVSAPCIMDKKGEVIANVDKSSIVKSDGLVYSIPNVQLKIGTRIEFKGILIQCVKEPCYNIIECYKIIETPPMPCVMDKKGVIISGIQGYENALFVVEPSPISAYRLLYSIDNSLQIKLKSGDEVKFGAKLISKDSVATSIDRILGDVTCIEIISYVPCVMDKKGEVVAIVDKSSIVKSGENSYSIPNVQLRIGTKIEFKGILIQCVKEPCYNRIECYKIIETPPTPCVMDKKGVIISGIQGYENALFVVEPSPISAYRLLYSIDNSLQIKLKSGDEVKFGAKLIPNDSVAKGINRIIGIVTCIELVNPTPCVMDKKGEVVAIVDKLSIVKSGENSYSIPNVQLRIGTKIEFKGILIQCVKEPCYNIIECYKIIETPPTPCVMNMKGKVVAGNKSCGDALFIQDISTDIARIMLYKISPTITLSNVINPALKIGDEVKFGGVIIPTDSLNTSACPVVGIAYCYELINKPVGTLTLTGKAMVENEVLKSGMVYLYRKGNSKPLTATSIVDGTYLFSNVSAGLYTVYVIPNIIEYPNCLPTFYSNKFRYSQADYILLNEDINNIVVMLNRYDLPKGNGIVRGNIFFENIYLKDSVMKALVQFRGNSYDNDRSAASIPVILYNGSGEAVAWTVSDEHGNYSIENLIGGSYLIVSESGSAKAESTINLTDNNSMLNADLILKVTEDITGLENINIITDFYPNPVLNTLYINVKTMTEAYLYNVMGQIVFHKKLNQGLNSIDCTNLQQGIYLLKTDKNTIRIRKN